MKLKKIISAIAVIIFIIIAAGFFLFIFPFTGTKKISSGAVYSDGKIFNVVDGFSQVFIIDGGNKNIALVDAGNTPDGKPIIKVLNDHGLKASDVKSIFLTHGHSDHIAAVKIFLNAKIYVLKNELDYAEGLKRYDSPIGRFFPPKPTGLKAGGIINDGDVITLGSLKVEAFAIPGHTDGGAAYLIGDVLFMGDAAISSSESRIKHAVWVFSKSVEQQDKSLKALAEKLLPRKNLIKNIVFAHSGPLDGLQPLIDYAGTVK